LTGSTGLAPAVPGWVLEYLATFSGGSYRTQWSSGQLDAPGLAQITGNSVGHQIDFPSGCSSSPAHCYSRYATEAEMEAQRSPSTSSAYAASPNKIAGGAYTPSPAITDADTDAARGVMGAPVAGKTPAGGFQDAAGNPLTPGQ